ncbi:Copper-exporting P-type ATPase B [Candidatus Bilamarchaeum dharawalense]|uniref:Copper-exporting P-type ATPase B n=1 Tax=Candidatus Bilamarchaeum dharawalense TaxID=2885759 RepID=A0A5E4LS91_9ARCH|nr:Copper-exporting P-type ATPase B [Candidatus Bilamarchaeum dharawalense]
MEWHIADLRNVHTAKLEHVFAELQSSNKGLSSKEAADRLAKKGPNTIAIKKEISPLTILINQFKNMLVLLLLFAAIVSFTISILNPKEADFLDAILIFAIVIANALFGFVQEYKAEKSIEALTKMSAPRATVVRDGKEIEIPAEEVVTGDILILEEGDKVAADARLVECFSMYADESMLTGESVPASKKVNTLSEKTPLAERSNMVFMNTIITRGRGAVVVVHTGLATEVGKIAKEISEAPEKVTQFQIEIEDLGKKVSLLTLGILIIIAVSEFLLGSGDILFIFMAAVALGVAAIPEGLPAVVTLALSIATNRMLKQQALMRRLSTVQDLGSVDVICTDKTGTLTENAMTVTRIYIPDSHVDVTGKGLSLEGKFVVRGSNPNTNMDMLFKCAILCNDAHQSEGGKFKGDPTEIAIVIPAYKAHFNVDDVREKFQRIGEVSFSADRKMMSTANSDAHKTYSFVKGAPEVVISKCTKVLVDGKIKKLSNADRSFLLKHNVSMASDALRVLAFAYRENPPSFEEEDMESNLTFLGLMGMMDPPRNGVKEAIADCRQAGIRVVMVTGDNIYTASAIGKELGFKGASINGDELDRMNNEEIRRIVEEVDIYARTSPKHKVLLLKALQANNHIVCMTGDGVNDAAAIKNSDVGIAMGIRGTEVTKQASDIVVLDDNFITIRNAIAEGRSTFDNIRKFVVYLLGANISEVLIVFIATITSLGISPKIAVQLLWINLVTDGLPALALGVDPAPKDIMDRKPRDKSERMVNSDTLYLLGSIGFTGTIALLVLYSYTLSLGDAVKGYTILFTSIVVMELFTVYVVRWRYKTRILSNKWLHLAVASSFILQLVLLYTPLNAMFGIVPLTLDDWSLLGLTMAGYLILLFLAMNLEKLINRKSKN